MFYGQWLRDQNLQNEILPKGELLDRRSQATKSIRGRP
jgi:hypothetical protein